MEVIRTLKPGQHGTIKLTEAYGDKLIAVRYRLDKSRNRQLTTIELIVDEREMPEKEISRQAVYAERKRQPVAVKINYLEAELREKVKKAGGFWDAEQKVWWLPLEQVSILMLQERQVSGLKCPDMYIYD